MLYQKNVFKDVHKMDNTSLEIMISIMVNVFNIVLKDINFHLHVQKIKDTWIIIVILETVVELAKLI